MKILFTLGWYYPAQVGGVARMTHNLAKELVHQGHEVTVWTTDYLNGRKKGNITKVEKTEDIIDGVKVKYFKGWWHRFQARTKQTISFGWFLKFYSSDINEFEVVHIFESRAISTAIYMTILRIRKKRVFHSAFGALGSNRGVKIKIFDMLILKPFLNKTATGLLAQTEHEKEVYFNYLKKNKYDKVHLLPLGTNVAENRNYGDKYRGALNKKLGKNSSMRKILYLGRLTPNKGILRLVEAFSNLSLPNVVLIIVGYDEGELANIKELIIKLKLDEKCFFLGETHGNERFGYYANADAYAITSTYYEETSLASVEALSVGTPCIVTPEVGLPYLAQYNGGITAESNIESITESLKLVLENIDQYKEGALKISKEVYDIASVVKELTKIYKLN